MFLVIISCSKEVIDESYDLSKYYTDQVVEQTSQIIATHIDQPEFRNYIYNAVSVGSGGDFQVLLKNIPNTYAIWQNKQFVELVEANPKLRLITTEYVLEYNESFTSDLLVVVSPDNDDAPMAKALTYEGKDVFLEANQEPKFEFISVGYCETCEEDGSFSDDVLVEVKNDKKDQLSLRGSRVSGNDEFVVWYKCPDLNAIEKWWNGKPEIRFKGAVGSGSNATQAYSFVRKPSRSAAEAGIYGNLSLFTWFFDEPTGANNGPNYYFQVFEENDSGSTQELTVGLSVKIAETAEIQGTNYKFTYKANDKDLVGRLIDNREDSPKGYYSSSLFHYQLRNL